MTTIPVPLQQDCVLVGCFDLYLPLAFVPFHLYQCIALPFATDSTGPPLLPVHAWCR